ncbi:MAG: carboxypeptidase-like regulatory domain-containing protein [Planctomycetota bacterium]|jgi:hypothetical protein
MRTLLSLLALAVCAHAGDLTGVVLDANGQPAAAVVVRFRIGWAHYALTPDYDRWHGVGDEVSATSDDKGRFTLPNLPPGAVVTAYARTSDAVAVAWGTDKLELKLGAFSGVKGKVSAKRSALKSMRIWVSGGNGLGTGGGNVDRKSGKFEVGGLTPGAARVHIKHGNFDVAVLDVMLGAGQTVKLKTVKDRGKLLAGPDPRIDCVKARLVDGAGTPLPGVQLTFSSRFMDGGLGSDDKGIVKLVGGGVAIGGPPFLLRLGNLRGKEQAFTGALKKVWGGVAIVELQPLHAVTGTVKRGDAAVEHYRIVAVGPGPTPRVFSGTVADGRYTILLPRGACRLVVGTADGKLHSSALDVQRALDHAIALK